MRDTGDGKNHYACCTNDTSNGTCSPDLTASTDKNVGKYFGEWQNIMYCKAGSGANNYGTHGCEITCCSKGSNLGSDGICR